MPAMSPRELIAFLDEHFPQAGHLDLEIEHLDDTTIRVRLPTKDQHLRPGGTISGPTLAWLVDVSFYLLLLGRLGPAARDSPRPVAAATSTVARVRCRRVRRGDMEEPRWMRGAGH